MRETFFIASRIQVSWHFNFQQVHGRILRDVQHALVEEKNEKELQKNVWILSYV